MPEDRPTPKVLASATMALTRITNQRAGIRGTRLRGCRMIGSAGWPDLAKIAGRIELRPVAQDRHSHTDERLVTQRLTRQFRQ
jgi:hypothetical protein